MKIWLSKNSEVPVREQIITQITLGVASKDLKTGERLPSTSEISRRFGVHANTVGSAYQKLVEQGLIEFKKGSGFFVSENKQTNFSDELKLDTLVAQFFKDAQTLGFSTAEIKANLQKWFSIQPPECFLVIESDECFREILIEEIKQATNFKVVGTSFEEFQFEKQNSNVIFAAMIDEKPKIETVLPPEKTCIYLKARSVSNSMTGETRPSENDLIAVVSGWEKFLLWSKTILVAANIESASIILRPTFERDWQKGLQNASMIICDTLAAKKFPNDARLKVFRAIADDSIRDLREIAGNK
jgi:GntR family transcriptional regulator